MSEFWNNEIDVWRSGQTLLPPVIRWKSYVARDGTRQQNCLQHSYSLGIAARFIIAKLRPFVRIDEPMVNMCVLVHDHGEGEKGFDTELPEKQPKDDVDEYIAFRQRFRQLDLDMFQEFERAFLLQFCQVYHQSLFPERAQVIMKELAETKRHEALVFEAIEIWDYMLYAMEHFHRQCNTSILVNVMRNNFDKFDRLSKELPGLDQTIWTTEIRTWFKDLIQENEGQWIWKKAAS